MGVSRQEYWSGPCSAKPLILLASIFPGEKVGGLASKSCLDPGDETAVLEEKPPGRSETGWGAGGSSCRGEALGWERGAPVPGVALPCVTQDRFTRWGVSSSVTGGAREYPPRLLQAVTL